MFIESEDKNLVIKEVDSFNDKQTFECGQCFRWQRQEDNSYIGVVNDRVTRIKSNNDTLVLYDTSLDDFEKVWRAYLDLDRDYSLIKSNLAENDEVMKEAIGYGQGIHILQQDLWETIISFIISANNRIPQIKKVIYNISEMFGKKIIWNGKEYYTFPKPEELVVGTEDDFAKCGSGFRAKYIKAASQMIHEGVINLNAVREMSFDESSQELMKIPGVGIKVASCALLYGGQKYNAFPVDVWIKRIMHYFYNMDMNNVNKTYEFAYDKFGEFGGFAQQYLFYYAREKQIRV